GRRGKRHTRKALHGTGCYSRILKALPAAQQEQNKTKRKRACKRLGLGLGALEEWEGIGANLPERWVLDPDVKEPHLKHARLASTTDGAEAILEYVRDEGAAPWRMVAGLDAERQALA